MKLLPSRCISVAIARSADEVYRFTSNPENLPRWASGLGDSGRRDGDTWIAESPMGRIRIEFAEENPFGVLDHYVTLESGVRMLNPMRVVPNGEGSEVMFTLYRQADMTEEKFEEDARWVAKDLAALKALLER